jgi:PAS domain S-box-containing protein
VKQILASKQQTSIRGRLLSIMLFTSAVVLAATSIAFVVYEVANFRAQVLQHLRTLAAVIADNSAVPLSFNNQATAQEILLALKSEPTITAAILYDADGKLFASYPPGLDRANLPRPMESKGHRFLRDALWVFQPVYQEGKPIGTLYLRSSLAEQYHRLSQYALIALVILVVSFGAAAFLSSVLQKRISEPVLTLTRTALQVAEREDYSLRAPKVTTDEVGVLTDAFNRMLAQTQEHQARLGEQARLLDLSFDAIFVLDAERKVIYWNRGAVEMYGYSASEALGRNIDDLLKTVFPDDRQKIFAHLNRDGRWFGELRQNRKDGTQLVAISRWALDRDAAGKPAAVLETNNDITDRKRTEDELSKAQAELREHAQNLEATVQERTARLRETIGELEAFSYSISHDMRAPLRAMTAYAKALGEDFGEQVGADGKAYLDQIISASTRMDQLITDVLHYSRVTRSPKLLESVDLQKLVAEIVAQFPQLQEPAATVTIEGPLPPVLGDRASLGQCVSNLLTNGAKFVAPGIKPVIRVHAGKASNQPITVENRQPGSAGQNMVRIWFEDNGIGIAHQDLTRIFGIFERVHPREIFEGTGIGLAIVRKAVERMGGSVGVESDPGKGSRFWLELQVAEQKQ